MSKKIIVLGVSIFIVLCVIAVFFGDFIFEPVGDSPFNIGVPGLGEEEVEGTLALRVDQTGNVGGLLLTLVEVKDDSRCPQGVTCVWQGSVTALVRVQHGKTDVTKNLIYGETFPFEGHTFLLKMVEPNKVQGKEIIQSDYVLLFDVENEDTN